MPKTKIYLYTKFERFWHWMQTLLIILLLITGFEVHGSFTWLGFGQAVNLHNLFGISWIILLVFIFFWLLTTGEWKQYVPTTKKLFQVAMYYMSGIFKGEPHPVQKKKGAKHNPLQRLTYLGLAATILPIQGVTGLLYWTYNSWVEWGLAPYLSLGVVATLHMLCAFALLVFLVVHVYMTTTGHTVFAHIAAMFSGWEEIDDEAEVAEWEKKAYKGQR